MDWEVQVAVAAGQRGQLGNFMVRRAQKFTLGNLCAVLPEIAILVMTYMRIPIPALMSAAGSADYREGVREQLSATIGRVQQDKKPGQDARRG